MTNELSFYVHHRKIYIFLLGAGILLTVFVFCMSLCIGNYKTSIFDVISTFRNPEEHKQIYTIIVLSRLPRLIASIFVGAALSISGLVFQELFSNRMASPDILGVSSGASVGASVAIYCGTSFSLTSVFAFVMGIISVFITTITSRLFKHHDQESISMILAGIITGGFMTSSLGVIKYLSNDSQLSTITFWLLGGFYDVNYHQLLIGCPIIAVGILTLLLLRWKIIMLRHGDEDAINHGINAKLLRRTCIAITTMITAVSICISGTIGWIGLAIPNLMRIFLKNDGKTIFPLSIVYGSLFMEICDLLARTITNTEIPVGIISGFLGAIMFVVVLLAQMKEGK